MIWPCCRLYLSCFHASPPLPRSSSTRSSSSWLPYSWITPSFSTAIWSAMRTVEKRWPQPPLKMVVEIWGNNVGFTHVEEHLWKIECGFIPRYTPKKLQLKRWEGSIKNPPKIFWDFQELHHLNYWIDSYNSLGHVFFAQTKIYRSESPGHPHLKDHRPRIVKTGYMYIPI